MTKILRRLARLVDRVRQEPDPYVTEWTPQGIDDRIRYLSHDVLGVSPGDVYARLDAGEFENTSASVELKMLRSMRSGHGGEGPRVILRDDSRPILEPQDSIQLSR